MPVAPEIVDLREVKDGARRLLPVGHPLREALLREVDLVPRVQAEGLLVAYLRLALALRR